MTVRDGWPSNDRTRLIGRLVPQTAQQQGLRVVEPLSVHTWSAWESRPGTWSSGSPAQWKPFDALTGDVRTDAGHGRVLSGMRKPPQVVPPGLVSGMNVQAMRL